MLNSSASFNSIHPPYWNTHWPESSEVETWSKSILRFSFSIISNNATLKRSQKLYNFLLDFFFSSRLRAVKNVLFIQIFIVSPFRKWKHSKASFIHYSIVNNSMIGHSRSTRNRHKTKSHQLVGQILKRGTMRVQVDWLVCCHWGPL